ncbi:MULTISPECIES: hypothetical protein [unclassified Planococcus (in: firmicutes)]|uniref:hypothetical protein n=1 Tax=unclassified Planococcus (in: firmicutes) TaxID=2662419 RepID=UPI000C338BE4|nr:MULTISPECIES: hypothetical protein [unclassified Planococcus (in: firmicutes)]AUD13069.1 hypothetical protein CW734_04470 [Planococcus sp. MB-3u-03]PKG45447.1 hypothetical protein CXF66_12580 [Planococcus sp. Urea-trap-24]PKG88956.1 hypothetical protein CXF91_08955 [Planococcus sp. Urea-3u-39]PKH36324.1 hypothetical protein CXF77_14625 [Planococcus sp. MB-3u-09]
MTNYAVKAISWAVAYGAIAFLVSYLLGGEPGWVFFIGSLIAGFILFGVLRPIVQNKRHKKQQRVGERI